MALRNNESDNKDDRTLYIGNLGENVTENLLLELFYQAGPVDRVSVPFDKDTNKIKGFGFIEYKHMESIDYALNIFAGTKLFGRELNMKYRNASRNHALNQLQQQQPQSMMNATSPASLMSGFNPLAFAIGDLMRAQQQPQIQGNYQSHQRFVSMASMSGDLVPTTFHMMNEYPSARGDGTSDRGRDRDFVSRRRYQDREDHRSSSNPYRRRSRSRSRSPHRDRDGNDSRRRHRDRDNRDRSSSGSNNYHRWNTRK